MYINYGISVLNLPAYAHGNRLGCWNRILLSLREDHPLAINFQRHQNNF